MRRHVEVAGDFAARAARGELKFIKASESPTPKKRREAALERQRKYARRRGSEAIAELERKLADEENRREARAELEAEARKRLEEDAREAQIEREMARQSRAAEAGWAQ